MKYNILILLFFNTINAFSQTKEISTPIDSTTNKACFVNIHEYPGYSKEKLFINARQWVTESFHSSKAIQLEDKEAGIIVVKSYVDFFAMLTKEKMYFTIKIYLKENKCKFEFTDIYYQMYAAPGRIVYAEQLITDDQLYRKNGSIKKGNLPYKTAAFDNYNIFIDSFTKSMIKVKNDW